MPQNPLFVQLTLTYTVAWGATDIFGPDGNALLLLDNQEGIPRDIALFQFHEGETWIARSEPTLDNRLAITVANEKNKVLLTGIGDLVEIDFEPLKPDLPPKKGHQLIVTYHETYKWKQSNPGGCAHCAGSTRTTTPSATPDYSAPDGGSCFTAGTPVMLANNVTKPTDKLRIGDSVLARDEETGMIATRRIRHVWMHNVQSTLMLQLANGEQIGTTPRHQFAVAGTGFAAADSLELGRKLHTH
jgi:hypothetical protein